MGGDNFYWTGTPLLDLYLKHEYLGENSEISIKDTGKDDGKFETKNENLIRKYRWLE